MTSVQLPTNEQADTPECDEFFNEPEAIAERYPRIFGEFVVDGKFSMTDFMKRASPYQKSFESLTSRAAERCSMPEIIKSSREFHIAGAEHVWPPAFAPFLLFLFFVGLEVQRGLNENEC